MLTFAENSSGRLHEAKKLLIKIRQL